MQGTEKSARILGKRNQKLFSDGSDFWTKRWMVMGMDNFCAFREYIGDVGYWRCIWTNGPCERLTRCKKPPEVR